MPRLMNLATRFSRHMRSKRFERFERLVSQLPQPLRILDVGGMNQFWEACGLAGRPEYQIFVLNQAEEEQKHENIRFVLGDATDLSEYEDKSFDLAFSNSVIEHLFTFENQRAMASEMQRVAHAYWVQTPNFWFPMEPHFHFVGWQWLPLSWRIAIIRRRRCGWRGKTPDPVRARRVVEEVRLMKRKELEEIFPEGRIEKERFLGIVKSWIVIGGLPASKCSPSR